MFNWLTSLTGTWLVQPDSFKICSRCMQQKPVSEFWTSTRNGYQSYCKRCTNLRKRLVRASKRIDKSSNTSMVMYEVGKEKKR